MRYIMSISLQKLTKSVLIASMLSSTFVHAADVTTSTTITAKVKNPTKLVTEYSPKATLIANTSNDGKVIGILSVSGYASNTSAPSLRFTDNGKVSKRLTFTNVSDPQKSFQAKMRWNGTESSPWINNGPGNMMGDLPEKVNFYITVHNTKPISAGQYSNIISVTALNQ